MPDEFPTLEAVAALGVLALVIRAVVVASETKALPRFADDLARSLRAGDRAAALAACSTQNAPALGRVARELISHVGEPPYGPDATFELRAEQGELEQDLARRGESGRARDLIVLAVLIGAMAFATLSRLPVTAWFQALAAAASLLLVVGYVMRSRLRRVERADFVRIGEALAEHASPKPQARIPGARACIRSTAVVPLAARTYFWSRATRSSALPCPRSASMSSEFAKIAGWSPVRQKIPKP